MPLNVEILEQSFKQVEPRAGELAVKFYDTLFTECPAARSLFVNTDMEKQQKKLIMSLVFVIANLRYPEVLANTLKDLGEKHARYGALREHYPVVGTALLKTLEAFLGSDWTPRVKQAWVDAYAEITRLMLEGATHCEASTEVSASQAAILQQQDALPEKTFWRQGVLLAGCGIVGITALVIIGFVAHQSQTEFPQKQSFLWQQETIVS